MRVTEKNAFCLKRSVPVDLDRRENWKLYRNRVPPAPIQGYKKERQNFISHRSDQADI